MSRKRISKESIEAVFELREVGYKTAKISKLTGLGRSTVQGIVRVANDLKSDNIVEALREFGTDNTDKLTKYIIDKVWWICEIIGISAPNEEEIAEAWKQLHKEREEEERERKAELTLSELIMSGELDDFDSTFEAPAGYRFKRETKSDRIQLLVSPTVSEGLKKAAKENNLSVNELCNRIFYKYLNKSGIAEEAVNYIKLALRLMEGMV